MFRKDVEHWLVTFKTLRAFLRVLISGTWNFAFFQPARTLCFSSLLPSALHLLPTARIITDLAREACFTMNAPGIHPALTHGTWWHMSSTPLMQAFRSCVYSFLPTVMHGGTILPKCLLSHMACQKALDFVHNTEIALLSLPFMFGRVAAVMEKERS